MWTVELKFYLINKAFSSWCQLSKITTFVEDSTLRSSSSMISLKFENIVLPPCLIVLLTTKDCVRSNELGVCNP